MKKFLALLLLSCLLLPCLNSCLEAGGLTPETTTAVETTTAPAVDINPPSEDDPPVTPEDESTSKMEEGSAPPEGASPDEPDSFDPLKDAPPIYNGSYNTWILDKCACELSLPIDLDPWNSEIVEKPAGTVATVNILGEELSGVYQYTANRDFESAIVERYEALDRSYWFELDYKDGSVKRFKRLKHDFEGKADVITSSEQAMALAKELAASYIQDMSRCKFTLGSGTTTGNGMTDGVKYDYTQYAITYQKTIDGYETSEYFYMTISSKGTVESFTVGDVNAYASLDNLQIDEEEIFKSIEYRIKKSYCEYEKFKDYAFTIEDIEYQIWHIDAAPDGTLYVNTDIRIIFKDTEGGTHACGLLVLTDIGVTLNIE